MTLAPRRIVIIQPCCIGDVILATPALKAIRRAYPHANITWAVGTWSRAVIAHHDLLDDLLDTGPSALPVKSLTGFLPFVRQLRAGRFDLAVSFVRSPLMSAACLLSGIPTRAGIDSARRGFGYTHKLSIDPLTARPEAEIYLDVVRLLGINSDGCYANVPVHTTDTASIAEKLRMHGLKKPYFVVNPAGGSNPGMEMTAKRYPPHQLAMLTDRLSQTLDAVPVVIAGPQDGPIIDKLKHDLITPQALYFVGTLSFGEIAALAAGARLYLGNDTGLTHFAAAAGARTAMIFGPSDPRRYAPYTPQSIALWRPTRVSASGVSGGEPENWDWSRDGISVDEAYTQIVDFLALPPQ